MNPSEKGLDEFPEHVRNALRVVQEHFDLRLSDLLATTRQEEGWQPIEQERFAASEAARIEAEAEVERLREALDEIIAKDRLHGPIPGSAGKHVWHDGPFAEISRAALRREPSTALESGKTEGGRE